MASVVPPPLPALDRPWWAQALALFGSFTGAIAIGTLFGIWGRSGSDALVAVQTFALLIVFIGGMAAWGAIAASIMARTLFNGDIVAAFLRFFLRGRRKEDLPSIELRREVLLAAAHRVFGWTRIFPLIAIGLACIAAPVAGLLSDRGFVATTTLSAALIVAYGTGLRALARRGYLIPPDLE